MKLARQRELLAFFRWLAGFCATDLPDNLLGLMLLYALHIDSDLDVEKIYHTLSSNPELEKNTMSVAEQLKAEGRVEGLWIGKIQALEEFLEKPQTSREFLESMPLEKLETLHQDLRRQYETHFKRR